MHVILSEGRKIESRCQLKTGHRNKIETQTKIWKRNKRTPVNDHIDAWAGARNGLDLKLVRCEKEKETWYEECGLRKREKRVRERKTSKGGRTRHEAFPKIKLQQETRPVGALLHQMLPKQPFVRRDGEKITQKKKSPSASFCQKKLLKKMFSVS